MTLVQQEAFALATTAATTAALGLFAYLKNPHRRLNRIFGFYSLSIAWWAACEALADYAGIHTYRTMYETMQRLEFIGVYFIPTLFLDLLQELTHKVNIYVIRFSYCISTVLVMLTPTSLIIKGSEPRYYWPLIAIGGPLYDVGFLFFTVVVVYGMVRLFQTYRETTGNSHNQLKYFLFASIVGYVGGTADFAGSLGFRVPILNPYGIFGVAIYAIITTYAIVQHRLLDISVVFRKSLAYSILVTSLTVGYFGLVYVVERTFQMTLGYNSMGVSFTAFALMALLFQPLKHWIQGGVDQLIFKVPQEELAKRLERLEEETLQTEKLKTVATLAAGLCHELRNPLQAVQTYAEYLPEHYDDLQFREKCSEVMQTELTKINGLLKQLMDFAKPKPPLLQRVEPHKILDSTLDLLSNEFVSRQIHIEKHYEAIDIKIQADPDQFRQVILNLALNAVQAVEEEGRVVVATRQEDDWFIIEVSDSGPGINPKILSKLFEPFNTTKPTGTGLGLSVAQRIITEHRGSISANSFPGQGATFTVKLPI